MSPSRKVVPMDGDGRLNLSVLFSRLNRKEEPKDFTKCPWCSQKAHNYQIVNDLCPNCRGRIR